jgi:hypothetical protein
MRRTFATTLTAGLLLLGCTAAGDDDLLDVRATEDPAPEPPEEPEPDPEPDDPYAVPDEIDEAYVELVINAILEVRSEILRGALQQEQGENLDPELMTLLFATTDGAERLAGVERFQGYIDDPSSRENLRDVESIGTTTFRPELIVHAEPERCIVVVGFWDNSEIVQDPRHQEDFVAFSLARVPDDAEVSEGNPTPWQWVDNAAMVDGEGPIPKDLWSELDYHGALEHTCEKLR